MKREQIVHHNEANPVLSKHPAVFHILELLYLRYIYNGFPYVHRRDKETKSSRSEDDIEGSWTAGDRKEG